MHAPLQHVGVAPPHATPQRPQFAASLLRFVQVVAVPHRVVPSAQHIVPAHACALEHRVVHAPHEVATSSGASQPFAGFASQSPRVAMHALRQASIVHAGVVPGRPLDAHRVPHAPQLLVVDRSISQPLPVLRSQSPKPIAQATPHTLAAHDAVALVAAGQRVPHAPQLFGSVRVSTHDAPQRVCPAAHPLAHVPIVPITEQSGDAAGHTVVQLPHDVGASSADSQPFAPLPSQSAKPLRQRSLHAPMSHCGVALVPPTQAVGHVPQC